nr:hypothetical protein [Bacillus licheniformis]
MNIGKLSKYFLSLAIALATILSFHAVSANLLHQLVLLNQANAQLTSSPYTTKQLALAVPAVRISIAAV